MKRVVLSLLAATAALILATTAISGGGAAKSLVGSGAFALIAFLAGAIGLALGIVSWNVTRRLRQDLDRVAHSLDGALKTLAGIGQRNTSTIEELTDSVNRDIGRLAERLDRTAPERPVAQIPSSGNVVALPVVNRPARNSRPGSQQDKTAAPSIVPVGPIEVHLEPIVSLTDSAAAGFEAYAGGRLDNGDEFVVRRLSETVPAKDRIKFELSLFEGVVTASRRQLGNTGRDIPIHVAVSRDFLADATASARVADLFKLHQGLEGQIVLSLADAPSAGTTSYAKTLAKLRQAGVHFALETAPEAEDAMARMASAGISYLKLTADRLLDRERARPARSGSDIAQEAGAANVVVIASGVASDEDALALMDLGVDMMTGPRFSGPRRLKPAMPSPNNAAQGG